MRGAMSGAIGGVRRGGHERGYESDCERGESGDENGG